jgi:predicted O-linked N-acetylglucosamine transferase (SPINDLY family)
MLATNLSFTDAQSEQEIENIWHLGLQHILADNPEEAHATILMPFLEITSEIEEELVHDSLAQFLKTSASQQKESGSLNNTHKIVGFIQNIFPNDLNNLLHLVIISAQLDELSFELLTEHHFQELLENAEPGDIDQERMYQAMLVIVKLLTAQNVDTTPWDLLTSLLNLSISKAREVVAFIQMFLQEAFLVSIYQGRLDFRIKVLEVCLEHCREEIRFDLLCQLAISLVEHKQYNKSISIANELYSTEVWQHDKLLKMVASQHRLHCLMQAGHWHEIPSCAEQHIININSLVTNSWDDPEHIFSIMASECFLNYCYDQPRAMHSIRNGLGELASSLIKKKFGLTSGIFKDNYPMHQESEEKVLRIGYIASTLTAHSVGWLSRWIFLHHDSLNFEVFTYNICVSDEDQFNIKYFRQHSAHSYYPSTNTNDIVKQIQKDKIDILIDLDSLTFGTTYEVLCCKPAPIQVTWLGWDTSGCPEIDYFIADPYVLPADAEDYYHSKIWRLPHTYVAVDGFEISVPTRKREDYGIPSNAIVYLCGQQVYKYHPDNLRLHMSIIKEVPNSYLLIKLRGDREYSMARYQKMAEEVGISMESLRFLEPDADEYIHRANLSIADVALDTFPYNGATTTLEIIWAGVPLVTKVGESFFARNSYTFLTNANITEGIAKTDEEYMDWAIRLGKDVELRQQVSGKMLQSRKNAPLWNAKAFTKEMEKAYRQMWQIYQDKLGQAE